MAQVNEWKTIDATRVLEPPRAELCQSACSVMNEQKILCSQQFFPEWLMNKFRAYIHRHMFCPSQDSSVWPWFNE